MTLLTSRVKNFTRQPRIKQIRLKSSDGSRKALRRAKHHLGKRKLNDKSSPAHWRHQTNILGETTEIRRLARYSRYGVLPFPGAAIVMMGRIGIRFALICNLILWAVLVYLLVLVVQ